MPDLATLGRRLSRSAAGWLGAGVLLFVATPVAAQTFTDVFVFGDSLSDTGNACTALVIAGYAPGRCSNGDVWSERFAEGLGLSADASALGGTNYAVGSHKTTDLDDQLFAFSPFGLLPADPDALYVIWLGGNNVLALPTSPTAMQEAVDDIIDGIRDLQALGAQHFMIPNLPDIGRGYGHFALPTGSGSMFTPAERDTATALSLDFNDRLATALAAEPITTLYELDIAAIVEEFFANPLQFGLVPAAIDDVSDDTDFGVPCLVDLACVLDPQGAIADGYFLFDAIHPTTVGHAVLADRAVLEITGPTVPSIPGPGLALLASLLLGVGVRLTQRRGASLRN